METTKELIKANYISQYRLMEEEKINIKGLCQAVPIARTTFYTHYDNLAQVKEEIEQDLLTSLRQLILVYQDYQRDRLSLFLDDILALIEEKRAVFSAFLVQQPNYHFIQEWKQLILQHFKSRYYHKTLSVNIEIYMEVMTTGAIAIYTYFLQYPEKVERENLRANFLAILEISERLL